MAWVPPTKHLKTKELTDSKRFYRELSAMCNFVDDETATQWYIGLVRLISQELRNNKFVRLPHIGDLALSPQKRKVAWCGKAHVYLGPTETLRFYPHDKMRRYFAKRKNPTV
ncbi:MAG: hypothetical protein Q7S50_00110 [bacterium]|nr:hypothetical protein [bacterium]